MSAEFELLDASQRRAVAATGILQGYKDENINFNDLDDIVAVAENSSGEAEADKIIFPENRSLLMPSTCLPQDHPLSKLELRLRKVQANRYLTAIREVIAEKSFQYTDVMRVAPRKAVVTRARNTIIKINQKLTFYAKVYSRCRAAMLRLAADTNTLNMFRVLTKHDVKVSTAVKNPNAPGSTTLSLSWIWQTSTAGEKSPATLRECNLFFKNQFKSLICSYI